MQRVRRFIKKFVKLQTILVLLVSIILLIVVREGLKNRPSGNDKRYPFAQNFMRKDWHNWKQIEYEKSRAGFGEQGDGLILKHPDHIQLNEKLFKQEGLNALISDIISVNRSLPDARPEQ